MNETINEIKWFDDYNPGYGHIDSQHRDLVERLGRLAGLCNEKGDKQESREELIFAVIYTIMHFRDEEDLFLRYDYPDYERHKRLHDIYRTALEGLIQSFIRKSSIDALNNDVHKFVVQWLVNHIKYEDYAFIKYLRDLDIEGLCSKPSDLAPGALIRLTA